MNTIQISKLADVTLTLAPEATELKKKALEESRSITTVCDAFTYQNAADALVGLQKIIKGTENGYRQCKDPVNELGREIDKIKRDFLCNDVEPEKKRLQKIMGDYDMVQNQIRAIEQAKKDEELRKAEAERVRVEEDNRKKLEAAQAKLDKAKNEEQRAKAEEALRIQLERDNRRLIEARQKAEEARNAPVAVVTKAAGASSNEVWKVEVTDIKALYAFNPSLCRIEANKEALNRELAVGVRSIPGCRIYSEMQIVARG